MEEGREGIRTFDSHLWLKHERRTPIGCILYVLHAPWPFPDAAGPPDARLLLSFDPARRERPDIMSCGCNSVVHRPMLLGR